LVHILEFLLLELFISSHKVPYSILHSRERFSVFIALRCRFLGISEI
jgi:hypothetical protein